ncbi:hypothetical protein [Tepidibacter formicigenes]|jgi:uncharacterized membrane protein YkgB|uniref:DUF4190 domain-containing protein n=1 Tax=Tepidibacter formicigenes DSM 15518 TaxID=1123349 RepID=A0A1M6RDS8_9FIRM|nr:hypothetical protein [Tepidibacter formicigenes]SHK30583.1 hypothetical protein SAMN02744037_02085 [Tepidibacter formicigenes DSM 15518]
MSRKHNNRKDNKKYRDDNVEYATEFAPNKTEYSENRNYDNVFESSNIIGYLAILSSIVSLFTYPVTFGVIGIVLGIVSVFSKAKTLGYWAIGIGLVTSLTSLFFKIAVLSFIFRLF